MVVGRDAVYPAVRLPALLRPVRRGVRLEPGRGVRRLPGQPVHKHPGGRVRVPRRGVGPRLRRGEGPHLRAAGQGTAALGGGGFMGIVIDRNLLNFTWTELHCTL